MTRIAADAQAYYDLLASMSRAGGFPSSRREARFAPLLCLYRSPGGRMCGVGAIMPDEVYEPGLEARAINSRSTRQRLKDWSWLPDGIRVQDLQAIQSAHDGVAAQEKWDHAEIIGRLNALPCFAGVVREGPA